MATGLEQSAAKVSADRTGADDENSHNCSPSVVHFNRALLWFALDQTTRLI
jgi:hypothetical protein